MQWKKTTDHNVAVHDDRLSGRAGRTDIVRIDETGSGDDDVTATAGACAKNEDQIDGRRHIHSGALRPDVLRTSFECEGHHLSTN